MKILLISGHGAGDSGALGNGYKEANETIRIAKALEKKLEKYADVIHYPYDRNAYADINKGKFAVSLSGVDYVFEIHLNSFKDKTANGTEIFVTSKEKSTGVEKLIMKKMGKYFSVRGVKVTDFLVIKYCKNKGISSALIETCFISNSKDMKTYEKNFDGVVQAMCDGIIDGFGLKKTSASKPSKPTKPAESKPTKKKLEEDGWFGKETIKETQRYFGTTVDGVISNQPKANKKYLERSTVYWKFKTIYKGGSVVVRKMQKLFKVEQDGYFGKNSVKGMQKFLNKKGYKLEVDGFMGPATVKAWQMFLNKSL